MALEKALDLYLPEYPVSDALKHGADYILIDNIAHEILYASEKEGGFDGDELEKEAGAEFLNLVQLCYRTPRMTHFMLYYYQQTNSDVEMERPQPLWWYREHGYVEHTSSEGVYILLKPFREAFQDLTEYKPLLDTARGKRKRKKRMKRKTTPGAIRVYNWLKYHGVTTKGSPEPQGTVECPLCGEEAEGFTQQSLIDGREATIQIYRHPNGKPLSKNTQPNQPGLRYHIIPEVRT